MKANEIVFYSFSKLSFDIAYESRHINWKMIENAPRVAIFCQTIDRSCINKLKLLISPIEKQ